MHYPQFSLTLITATYKQQSLGPCNSYTLCKGITQCLFYSSSAVLMHLLLKQEVGAGHLHFCTSHFNRLFTLVANAK